MCARVNDSVCATVCRYNNTRVPCFSAIHHHILAADPVLVTILSLNWLSRHFTAAVEPSSLCLSVRLSAHDHRTVYCARAFVTRWRWPFCTDVVVVARRTVECIVVRQQWAGSGYSSVVVRAGELTVHHRRVVRLVTVVSSTIIRQRVALGW